MRSKTRTMLPDWLWKLAIPSWSRCLLPCYFCSIAASTTVHVRVHHFRISSLAVTGATLAAALSLSFLSPKLSSLSYLFSFQFMPLSLHYHLFLLFYLLDPSNLNHPLSLTRRVQVEVAKEWGSHIMIQRYIRTFNIPQSVTSMLFDILDIAALYSRNDAWIVFLRVLTRTDFYEIE